MKSVMDLRDGCVECNICVNECAFLSRHGTPGLICANYQSKNFCDSEIFSCNLCGLCNSVCPKQLDVTSAFLDLRREIQQNGHREPARVSVDKRHKSICTYEKTGHSALFSLHHLPDGCDTIFFPGCTLAATRSTVTLRTYHHLQTIHPDCGIVLDCCGKPSHDLGLQGTFNPLLSRLKKRLDSSGVNKIITACPSCLVTFREYLPEYSTSSIYEELSKYPLLPGSYHDETVTVHDACTTRNFGEVHTAVRTLLTTTGMSITEMTHCREKTWCCGEGAAASHIDPELTGQWKKRRKQEAADNRVITYCAGCSTSFGKELKTTHILDLLFDKEKAIAGQEQRTRSPFTYFRRLHLKRQFSQHNIHKAKHADKKILPGQLVRYFLLALLVAGVVGLQFSGIGDLFSADGVNELFGRLQNCHPAVFVSAFSLGMVLLLPASPFVIVSGLLYGPIWGIVYAILGATIGAALAFLVSRYLSADFIRHRLTGTRWRNLQDSVENHGWKMVAFSRLVPLFPFTLVNYAFGMTRVKFSHYVFTTGICMFPACLAFVLFSSSLADILHGHLSGKFITGLALIILVGAVPVIYNYMKKRGIF